MSYEAYLDQNKRKIMKARDAAIHQINQKFYCKTSGCNACMTLVDAANPDCAYFRRLPSSPKHSSIFCSADGIFNPTEYEETKFNFENLADKIINGSENAHIRGVGNSGVHGGGGKKSISTVKQIYLMCRKYTEYNGFCTNNILADERNFEKNKDGIEGKRIVQCTCYHKVKDEFSYIMNYPSFPYKNGKHIRIDFKNKALFWDFYNKVKKSNHKELILVLGKWKRENIGENYIARCSIFKNRQYSFLKS